MHRLTILADFDGEFVSKIANIIEQDAGYILQKCDDYQTYLQFYFDGQKSSRENQIIFEKCRQLLYPAKIDFILQEPYLPINLICFDMDGTCINLESMDEFVGEYLGEFAKEQMQFATNQVIEGSCEYIKGFGDKISVLNGIFRSLMKTFYNNKIRYKAFEPHLAEFLAFCHNDKIKTALLSGGFTDFAKMLTNDLGFCYTKASSPTFVKNYQGEDVFSGTIEPENICTEQDKKSELLALQKLLTIDTFSIMAIGDGTNDIAMLQTAGIGIAYKAKQKVKNLIPNWLEFSTYEALKCIVK